MTPNIIGRLLQQAGQVATSKSSVLVPLHWTFGMTLVALVVFALAHVPVWLLVATASAAALVLLLTGVFFAYFALTNQDALRSEQHVISKYAIDHGYYGDSDSGMIEGLPSTLISDKKLPIESGGQEQ